MVVRTYEDELKFIERLTPNSWRIKKGFQVSEINCKMKFAGCLLKSDCFQPNMNVEGVFYVNKNLEKLMFEELRNACKSDGMGGFLPGMKQIANVAALPGIVGK